ncbi:unnamed protein product, partial [Prorocentrum cordatum]
SLFSASASLHDALIPPLVPLRRTRSSAAASDAIASTTEETVSSCSSSSSEEQDLLDRDADQRHRVEQRRRLLCEVHRRRLRACEGEATGALADVAAALRCGRRSGPEKPEGELVESSSSLGRWSRGAGPERPEGEFAESSSSVGCWSRGAGPEKPEGKSAESSSSKISL